MMSITPTLDAVSRDGGAGGPGVRASAAYLLGQLCFPCELVMGLPGAGKLLLRPRLVERRSCDAYPAGGGAEEVIALNCAGQPALLMVERRTACGLVNAVLGLPPPTFAAPLTRIERGVLEGTVATILASLHLTPALGLRGGVGDRQVPGALAVAISVGLNDETGWAWLGASDASLERLCMTRAASSDAGAPWLELARTRVLEREMASAEVGDLLVFDETPALLPAGVWPAHLLWRGRGLPVRWSEDGQVSGIEDVVGLEDMTRPERRRLDQNPGATSGEALRWVDVSAGVECDSTQQFGRAPIIVPRTDQVRLKVGSGYYGRGSVTQNDGRFAVAITQKTND